MQFDSSLDPGVAVEREADSGEARAL